MKGKHVNTTTASAQLPWYRHRWPWLLMLGPLAAILGGMATLYFAVTSFDGLVADDYYKQGLAINKTLERVWRAGDLGMVASVHVVEERLNVRLAAHDESSLPKDIRIQLVHPARAGLDRELDAAMVNGAFEVSVAGLMAGRWQLVIEDAAGTWRLSGSMALPEQTEATFRATKRP